MYDYAEKRKYIRIEKPYMARFRVRPDGDPGAVSTDWDIVAINDLGAGGVFLNSSSELEIGTVLTLKIGFSTTAPSIKCDGIVTRVVNQPNTSIFGIATAFTKIDEHIKEIINKIAGSDNIINTPAVLSLVS